MHISVSCWNSITLENTTTWTSLRFLKIQQVPYKDGTSTCQIVFHHNWSGLLHLDLPDKVVRQRILEKGWTCHVSIVLSANFPQEHDLNGEGKADALSISMPEHAHACSVL